MKKAIHFIILFIVICLFTACANSKQDNTPATEADFTAFDLTMHEADSLYNNMDFRLAYDLYLQLLDTKAAKADDERMLNVLNSLCMASELAGHKAEQTQWLEQLLNLARQTGNAYYEAYALLSMGKRVYYEGNKEQGIAFVNQAVDKMSETDRPDTDHLTSNMMIILAGLYSDMGDLTGALQINERNEHLTSTGTRWGNYPAMRYIDRRMALAKMAYTLAKMGDYRRADSAYVAWKAVQYEGNHARDYFIMEYLRERGRYPEAIQIYNDHIDRVRQQGDTLGEMMNTAKWGLAETYQKMGNYKQAAELYVQVLEIQDTLKSRQAHNTAQELAAVYQTQEQALELEREHTMNIIHRFIIALVLLLLVAITIYTVNVVRQKQLITEKNRFLADQIKETMQYKLKVKSLKTKDDANANLSDLSDEQLFLYLHDTIVKEQLFRDPQFGRQTIMDRFQLTKEQVGAAFSKGSEYASISEYAQELRLEYATLLFSQRPDMSGAQVASECGFSSYNYFRKCFRARFGMTPSEFCSSTKQAG